MPSEEAKRVDSIMGARGSEVVRVSGINSQYDGALAEKTRLKNQLSSDSYAATRAARFHTAHINELVELFNRDVNTLVGGGILHPVLNPLFAVTELNNGVFPFWNSGYYTASFGASINADIENINPVTDRHSVSGLETKFLSVNYGSSDEYPGWGPDSDQTLSPAFIRGVADLGQTGFLGSAVTQSKEQAFESTLGIWAIHAPFNGRIFNYTDDDNGTVIRIRYDNVNDPTFGGGRGRGWSTTTWSGWAVSAGAEAQIKSYYSALLNGSKIVIGDSRDVVTFSTYSRTIGAVTVSQDVIDMLIQPSFDPYALIVDRDIENRFGFAVADSHDITYGWTACFAWNPYWKDFNGNWVDTYVDGTPPVTHAPVEGSSLFINSFPTVVDGTNMGRDYFYQLNMGDHTLRNVTLSRAIQMQGIYSNMLKEISTSTSGFTTRYTALSNAVNVLSQAREIYLNRETYQGTSKALYHNERYTTLLGSSASSIALKVPVDTFEDSPTEGGIRFVLLTGKIAQSCKNNDQS